MFVLTLQDALGAAFVGLLVVALGVEAGLRALRRRRARRGYHAALEALRKPRPSAAEVAKALGRGSPDGSQGNVWALLDDRLRTVAVRTAFSWTQRPAEAVVLEPGKIEELPAGTKVR